MTKAEAIDKIRKAKLGHKRWMSFAKAISMGIPVDKKAVPMVETDCDFGKWYYTDGQAFEELDSFRAIEQPHAMIHEIYLQLYKLRRKPVKSGLFSIKLFEEKKRKEEINNKMRQMEQVSEMLFEALSEFEKEIKNMPEYEFSKFI